MSNEEIMLAASGASLVVLGMSSSADLAQVEIMAGSSARDAGVPYGFYGDVPLCWARARVGAWFEGLATDASFYYGVTQADADAAHAVFPKARLIGTGNPLREEMAFPRFSREQVRNRLKIEADEKLVLAPGGKFAAGNIASWVVVMEALSLLSRKGQRFQLVLATHPGDRTPCAVDVTTQKESGLYEELLSFSPVPTKIVSKDVLSTSEMVPGADIIIELGSSIGIEGAYQGVPVVSMGFEVMFRRLEQVSGTRSLEAVSDGLSELAAADANCLKDTIQRLLSPSGFVQMRARQRQLCPRPKERGAALLTIANAIAQMA